MQAAQIVRAAFADNAAFAAAVSDLHFEAGAAPRIRTADGLRMIETASQPLDVDAVLGLLQVLGLESDQVLTQIERGGGQWRVRLALDASTVARVSMTRFGGLLPAGRLPAIAVAMRRIASTVPSLEALGLPAEITQLLARPRGLLLVTGPTGSGKSTTLAALVEWFNQNRHLHVITIEQPLEYRFSGRACLIQQREVGIDVNSFEDAVEHALQQDPDVIVIGEIRNAATLTAAMRAASSGHLVMSTLHTSSATETVQRVQDFYPLEQRGQANGDLANCLTAVVSQLLLPSRDRQRRFLAHEIMTVTPALRSLIREGKPQQLRSEIDRQRPLSHSMNTVVAQLVVHGDVDIDVARAMVDDAADLDRLLVTARAQGRPAG